jgi:cyanophycinase-like exopeptidase
MSSFTIPDKRDDGTLILIGGGEFSFGETEEIDRHWLGLLRRDRKRVAFIPAASGSQEYARHFSDYLRRLDDTIDFTAIPMFRSRDAKRGKNLETLRMAHAIYIGGGQTNPMLACMRDTPAVEELHNALARGAIVVAIGAGAASLGVIAPDMQRRGNTPGLGLLPTGIVETGFVQGEDTQLRTLMAAPEAKYALAIPRGAAASIAPDGTATVVGEGSIAFVRKPETQA